VSPVLSIVMPYRGEREINLALAVTTAIDVWQIREYRLPLLYASGVRYRGELCEAHWVPGACERFLTYAQCLEEKFCDCDDLAPARAAELIVAGDAKAHAFCERSPIGWHCRVRHGNGLIECPSTILGMTGGKAYEQRRV
jgi:hypothetical protein